MRHNIAGNRLGRNQGLRKATVRDLARATLVEERILTTKAKAKEARKLVDQLITMGKMGTLAHRRKAFSILCDHTLVSELFNATAKRFNSRQGGYTRVIPLSVRRGDNAQLAFLELTEKTEVIVSKPKTDAVGKAVDVKKEKKEPVAQKALEEKKEKTPKREQPKSHPKQDVSIKEKPKTPKFMGGIRKMFTRKQGGE